MAGNRQITYEIGIDAGDATGTLRTFSGAVRSAMRSVESELEEGASSGEKLSAALEEIAQVTRQEFASAAIAADELGRALKEAGSTLNVADAVAQLNRLGLSFDEITVDADKLAQSLKQLDDAKAAGLADLDATAPGLATKLDEVSKSADSSKSALANMVGNSAQDLGQLGGLAGSVGVGIGQIAEYAADAAFEGEGLRSVLGNMAKVAGPMAALGFATAAVSTALGGIQAEKAFRAGLVDKFTDDMREAKGVAESLYDTLKDTGNLEVVVPFSGGFLSLGEEAKSLVEIVEELGLGWDEVVADINDPGAQARIRAMTADMIFQGDEGERLARLWNDYALGVDQYGDAWRDASGQQEISNRLLAEAEESGIANADAIREQQEALDDAHEAAQNYAIAVDDASGALRDVSSVFAELGRKSDALAAIFELGNAPLDLASETRDVATAIGELGDAAKDVDLTLGLDPSNVDADALLDKLDSLRPQIQAKVVEAFAAGGPEAAQATALDYINRIVEELDGALTPQQVADMLGLTDLDATVRVALDMATAERVRSQIEILTGLEGDTPFVASVRLALDAGTITPEAAEVLISNALGETGVEVPLDPTPPTPEQIAEANAFIRNFLENDPVAIRPTLDTREALDDTGELVDEIEDETPTMALDADATDAEAEEEGFRRGVEDTDATVGIDANALLAFAVLDGFINYVTRRRSVPVDAYIDEYPSRTEIERLIGRPRIPVDLVVGQTIRITGVRE